MKTFKGKVVSIKMLKTTVVEVVNRKPHALYQKLLKRSKKYKVDTGEYKLQVGDKVKIVETRPISKEKHFKIMEVLK